MRGIKAKQLRKISTMMAMDEDTSYTTKLHKPREVWTGKINDDGTKKMTVIQMATILLHPNCTRKVYKDLKAIHKA